MANFHVQGIDLSTGRKRGYTSADIKTLLNGTPDSISPTVEAQTSNYTIVAADNKKVFTNVGASGMITFTITEGINITFTIIRVANHQIRITSSGSDTIHHNGGDYTASENVILDDTGSKIVLAYDSDNTQYFALSESGMLSNKPGTIKGLVAHFDATVSASLTLSGSKVTTWADQSGNSNDVTQTSDANRPTLTSDAFGSGLDGVTFTGGSSTYMDTASWSSITTEPITMVAVVQKTTSGAGPDCCVFVGNSSLTNTYWALYFGTLGVGGLTSAISNTFGTETFQVTNTATINTTHIISFIIAHANSQITMLDGTGQFDGHTGWPVSPTNVLTLGRFGDSTPSGYLTGHIGEVMIWNRGLREDELRALHLHLADKWGATLG